MRTGGDLATDTPFRHCGFSPTRGWCLPGFQACLITDFHAPLNLPLALERTVHMLAWCFSAGGAKALLEPPVIKHEGLVPWWQHRHKGESPGVERWCPPDVEDGKMSGKGRRERRASHT